MCKNDQFHIQTGEFPLYAWITAHQEHSPNQIIVITQLIV